MANMSYCRFENTFKDLQDCLEDLYYGDGFSELSKSEQKYRNKLIDLCKNISDEFEEEEIIEEEDE